MWKKGDIILVHDYHLMLLPALLRESHPKAEIGWFLHTLCSVLKRPALTSAPARPLHLLRARLAALGRLGTPRVRPSHWAPRHRLGCPS